MKCIVTVKNHFTHDFLKLYSVYSSDFQTNTMGLSVVQLGQEVTGGAWPNMFGEHWAMVLQMYVRGNIQILYIYRGKKQHKVQGGKEI